MGTCTSSGRAGIDRGAKCMKMKTSGMITQVCDHTPGTESICAASGNPTACCTTATNAMIICSGAGGFSEAPKAADFNGCSAKCATVQVQDVSSGAAGTALSSISSIAGIIMAMRLA